MLRQHGAQRGMPRVRAAATVRHMYSLAVCWEHPRHGLNHPNRCLVSIQVRASCRAASSSCWDTWGCWGIVVGWGSTCRLWM